MSRVNTSMFDKNFILLKESRQTQIYSDELSLKFWTYIYNQLYYKELGECQTQPNNTVSFHNNGTYKAIQDIPNLIISITLPLQHCLRGTQYDTNKTV